MSLAERLLKGASTKEVALEWARASGDAALVGVAARFAFGEGHPSWFGLWGGSPCPPLGTSSVTCVSAQVRG